MARRRLDLDPRALTAVSGAKMVPLVPTKTCTKCEDAKPVTEFHRNANTRDGFNYWCKSCKRGHESSSHRKVTPMTTGSPETKVCSKCSTEKPRTDFYRASRQLDGLQGWCKMCQSGKKPTASDPIAKPDPVPEQVTPTVDEEAYDMKTPQQEPLPLAASSEVIEATIAVPAEEIPIDEMVLKLANMLADERVEKEDIRKGLKAAENVIDGLQQELKSTRETVEFKDLEIEELRRQVETLKEQNQKLQEKPVPTSQYRPETKKVLENLGLAVTR